MNRRNITSGALIACIAMAALFTATTAAPLLQSSENQQTKSEPKPAKAELKAFSKPDEIREFPKGRLELVKIGGATIGRAIFQPGWKWSESVQPLVQTKSCVAPHFQFHVSGVLRVQMDNGSVFDCKAGDVSLLPSGHDAWVVGDQPVVLVDFQGMLDYAKGGSR